MSILGVIIILTHVYAPHYIIITWLGYVWLHWLRIHYTGNPRKSAQGGITGLGGQNEQKIKN